MKQLTQEQLEQVYMEHPEWLVNLEAGKWYHYASQLLCYVGSDEGDIIAYGFDEDMRWIDKYTLGWESSEEWNPAHHKEVESALIAEARKRGFKDGVEINNSEISFRDNWRKIEGGDIEWDGEYLDFGNRGTAIFYNGKWADVRESSATVEVGKWYKLPDNANFLFCITELLSAKSAYGYGWCKQGKWHDVDNKSWGCEDVIPATDEEVKAALIAEAKRRYKAGDKLSKVCEDSSRGNRIFSRLISFQSRDSSLWIDGDNGYSSCIFEDGKWATVITPASTLASDIQALKDKYPNYNWTIIAEAKQ